jgi:hypothetical protein
MKIKVMMNDGKYLYVNKVLVEEKTFTVSSAPVELDDECFTLCHQFEPKMDFIVERTVNVQSDFIHSNHEFASIGQPHEIDLDFIVV